MHCLCWLDPISSISLCHCLASILCRRVVVPLLVLVAGSVAVAVDVGVSGVDGMPVGCRSGGHQGERERREKGAGRDNRTQERTNEPTNQRREEEPNELAEK